MLETPINDASLLPLLMMMTMTMISYQPQVKMTGSTAVVVPGMISRSGATLSNTPSASVVPVAAAVLPIGFVT